MKKQLGLVLFAFFLVACAPSAASVAAPAKIRIGYQPVMPMMPFFVAQEQGWWKELGAPVETIKFTSGPPMIQAFAAGDIDAAYIGTTPAAIAVARGVPIKIVANSTNGAMGIAMSKDLAALYKSLGPVQALSAFREQQGRPVKIATLAKGSAPDAELRFWLGEQLGLNPDTAVEIVPLGEEQLRQAMVANQVDAATLMEPFATMVAKQNLPFEVPLWSDAFLPGVPGSALALRTDFIQKYPTVAKKMVEIHLRATKFVEQKPDDAAKMASDLLGADVLPEAIARAALASPGGSFVANPRTGLQMLMTLNAYAAKIGVLPRTVSAEELYDFSLYDAVVKEHPNLGD
ncbi:MAG: ABC transporter substrate-binding protein [Chloroflexi bacterium]|nr:ABC transporter substrate-binding protein [Chloroflexota bacterium]